MEKLKEHLKEMISAAGLSGYETPIREIIESAWKPLSDSLEVSKLGSLHAYKYGDQVGTKNSVMICTHMDAIGLMVTRMESEFIHFTSIGGVDPRVLPGQMVTVHGKEKLTGYIIQPPPHTLPDSIGSSPIPIDHLLIDTGLSARELQQKVQIGDLISFATEAVELAGGYLTGHSLDNRVSVAALTEALKMLQRRKHAWDVIAVASTQEEATIGGAKTSGFQLRPTLAVVIDVGFAKSPGALDHISFEMDSGIIFSWGPNMHPKLFEEFMRLAKKLEFTVHKEIHTRSSGTDAMALQLVREGIPVMIIGQPLRYMHTPVEMIQIRDTIRIARLITEFIGQLDESFMDSLQLEAVTKEGKN